MASDLGDFAARMLKITDPSALTRINRMAGFAGKQSALEAASDSLGGDRRFSGFRRKVALSAGFDTVSATQVQINFRPAGLWVLADKGRRSSGTIRPRRGKRAVLTPYGPRATSSYGPSRGLNTYENAVKDAETTVPKAAFRQFQVEVGRALG